MTILGIVVGYILAVLFPVPWLSRLILDGWARLAAHFTKPVP